MTPTQHKVDTADSIPGSASRASRRHFAAKTFMPRRILTMAAILCRGNYDPDRLTPKLSGDSTTYLNGKAHLVRLPGRWGGTRLLVFQSGAKFRLEQ